MKNCIAVVAGASRGAGKGTALALAERGATVYILGRSTDQNSSNPALGTIDQTAREVSALGGRGIPYACDCNNPEELKNFFQHLEQAEGRLDLLVNAAWGGHDAEAAAAPFYEQALFHWEYMFEKGVKNYLLTTCAAIPLLQKGQAPLIVNISFWDEDKYTGSFYYDLSKQAMNRMALGLHHELQKEGIAAVALSPGHMKTERVMAALAENPALGEQFGVPTESTRYCGRAIAALYFDAEKAQHSGRTLRVADLARQYGFTDLDGSQPSAFILPD